MPNGGFSDSGLPFLLLAALHRLVALAEPCPVWAKSHDRHDHLRSSAGSSDARRVDRARDSFPLLEPAETILVRRSSEIKSHVAEQQSQGWLRMLHDLDETFGGEQWIARFHAR